MSRRDEIEKRLRMATPGPWELWGDDDDMIGVVVCEMWPTKVKVARSNGIRPFANTPDVLDNADFIAHAPDDVRWLLDELAARDQDEIELKEVLERELQAVLDVYDSHIMRMQFARQRLITRFGDLLENAELRESARDQGGDPNEP